MVTERPASVNVNMTLSKNPSWKWLLFLIEKLSISNFLKAIPLKFYVKIPKYLFCSPAAEAETKVSEINPKCHC